MILIWQIDVLLDAKAKVTSVAEVTSSQLVLSHLESSL